MEVPLNTCTYISLLRVSTWPHPAEKLALIEDNQVAAVTQEFCH